MAEKEKVVTENQDAAPSIVKPSTEFEGSPYDKQLKDLYDSITSRKPFQYDASDDPMYQQYQERYMQLGKQAMKDTMGQAAALTGGYGNSYAQGVGQQTYDQYMLGLNDKAMELYNAAYGRYQDEGDRMRQNFSMAGQLADQDYGRWADAYQRDLGQYTLGADEAAARAQYGDFGGYEALYGKDEADKMFNNWAAANPQLAYMMGAITEDQYKNLKEGKPINAARAAGGGGSVGGRALSDLQRDYNASVINRASNGNWTAQSYSDLAALNRNTRY